jgi:hypothetical protein
VFRNEIIDKENVMYIQDGIFLSIKKECNLVIGRNWGGTRAHHVKGNE